MQQGWNMMLMFIQLTEYGYYGGCQVALCPGWVEDKSELHSGWRKIDEWHLKIRKSFRGLP